MSYCDYKITPTSPAAPGTTPVTLATGVAKWDKMRLDVTLRGATGGTLDVYIQDSWDEGVTWNDVAHFTQLAGGASAASASVAPSDGAGAIVAIGIGTAAAPGVALAANTAVNGRWGDRLRVVFVAGSGTSAGAAQTLTLHAWRSAK